MTYNYDEAIEESSEKESERKCEIWTVNNINIKIFCSFLSYRFDYLPSTELSKKIFFLNKPNERVTLQVSPAVPEGTAHQWMWTSHDGRHSNTSVAQITSSRNRNPSWNTQAPFSKGTGYDLSIQTKFENAGEFVFMQTKPASAVLARFEVFSFVFKGIFIMFSFSMCIIWIILNINVYRLVNIRIRAKLLLL